ncbi:MAG TPA: type II toxin-antitoxin system VapC family toxin [Candidatus Eremiobacteraeota bacterium]|nr:type II toxin-antitoxin system VapC family toxin [Candidatus Eremiobacteraeota bacterium]
MYKDGSFSFLQAVASGEVEGVTDAIVLQEILYSLIKKAGLSKGLAVFDFISCIVSDVFSITSEDIFKLRELVEKYPDSSVRDLLHLSVMLDNEVSAIYTADNSFDMFAEIVRMDPVKFLKKGGKKKERHIF